MEVDLNGILRKYDCNLSLRSKQRECFDHLLHKKGDVIVNLPVGYGKSLIFHLLPELLGELEKKPNPICIVITPLNIIQTDQLRSLLAHGITACRLDIKCKAECATDDASQACDSLDVEKMTNEMDLTQITLNDVAKGRYSVVLCHPEALLNTVKGHELLENLDFQENVVAMVFDECHIIDKWGEQFRTAFQKLGSLSHFFPNVPKIGLSGTLTLKQLQKLPKILNMTNYTLIQITPDKPNIFLDKKLKPQDQDVVASYEHIFIKECDSLLEQGHQFPVTLMFLPVFYMSKAMDYLNGIFNSPTIEKSIFSAICSGQDKKVISTTTSELKKVEPRIRLVLCTSIIGLGFDPENVTRVLHLCPPRNLSQYVQEIGRAGRRGQPAEAILYYAKRDIAKNLPGITEDIVQYCLNTSQCLRANMLQVFGFEKDSSLSSSKCCSFCVSDCEKLEKDIHLKKKHGCNIEEEGLQSQLE